MNQGMVVIGIGYLFPIAAIWAAFDYWKLLFPDQNVEFAVTALYQAGPASRMPCECLKHPHPQCMRIYHA